MMRLAFFFAALALRPAAAAPNELGHPAVRDFPPGRSHLSHLCQAVAQDPAGFIYLANFTVARWYDGATWRLIALPAESAGIRKFAIAADGTVYAGGAGLIGYFRAAAESREFVSLAGRLPPTASGCDDIYDALAVGNTVYFADEEKILVWRDRRFTVIPCRSPPHSHGARLHRVGDAVYVTAPGRALCRLAGDRLEVVADDPVLRENQIVSVEAAPGGALALLTAERGFYRLDGGRAAPLPIEANRWLAGKSILCAQRLGDGSFVVAFTSVSGDGGMRFGADGRFLGRIDQSIGLYVKTLRGFFCDREGGLWCGTETGLFRIEWPSPLTVFDAINGLGQGAVAGVARHEGMLYAATAEGVYRLAPSDDRDGRCARFERVLSYPAYSLVSHPGGLLALGYADLYVQAPSGFTPVARLPAGGGTLLRSKQDPERVWIATTRGVQSVRHTPRGWSDEGPVPGFDENTRGLTEAADGSLWIPTLERGRFHLSFDEGKSAARGIPRIERLADGQGLPDDARWIARGGDVYRVRPGGGPPQRLPHLAVATAGAISRLDEEAGPGGPVLWISGANGLVRVEVARAFPAPAPLAIVLNPRGIHEGDRLPAGPAEFTFDYVALRHQMADSVSYQTRLAGSDPDWSPWSAARDRTFGTLPPGGYRFEVRARDADGVLSAPAALAFEVLAPWWRTPWALAGCVVAGSGLLAGVVRLRTRALRERAGRLEIVVAERTAELAEKNAELIRLNRLESDEKTAARLAGEKARLEVLRYQLNPHFLYNTLASISASLPAGRSVARGMVERLADFCRLTLHRGDDRDWTTLGGEMRLLRTYLEIEQSRWGDLLAVELACDPALDGERLPHFLLLPLVENALKFGRATSPDRVALRLAAARAGDGGLVLEVANTGEWIEPAGKKNVSSLGIGLDNLRERLARHYPDSHRLEFAHTGGWVRVVLRLPPSPVS